MFRRAPSRVVVAWFSATALLLALGGTAAAQDDDPYGSTSTTAPADNDPVCVLDEQSAEVGSQVTGTVTDVEVGTTVEFFLGGEKLGEETAEPEGTELTADVEFAVTIPASIRPGSYELVAVGATFNTTCAGPEGTDFEVLAAGEGTGGDGTGGEGQNGGDDGGALAFTGFALLGLVLVGLGLIAGGALVARRARIHRFARR